MPLLESHAFSRAQATRRIAASIILGVAMTQFVLGLTVLRQGLSGHGFLAYWGVCFLLVVVVLFLALLDVWEIRRQARSRTRDLMRDHLLEPDFIERLRHAAAEEDEQPARTTPGNEPGKRDPAASGDGARSGAGAGRSQGKEPRS